MQNKREILNKGGEGFTKINTLLGEAARLHALGENDKAAKLAHEANLQNDEQGKTWAQVAGIIYMEEPLVPVTPVQPPPLVTPAPPTHPWDGHTPPVAPSQGTVYPAGALTADDWVYYVQTPAVEWRVLDSQEKAQRINSFQTGGTQYGYFLDNFQRIRATYSGKLVQP